MQNRFLGPITAFLVAAGTVGPAMAQDVFAGLTGTYAVIDFRRNSTVAAPLNLSHDKSEGLGMQVQVTSSDIVIEGVSCDEWSLEPAQGADIFASDPVLSDLQIGPNDPPDSQGDARLNRLYRLGCEGEYVTTVFQPDRQVIVATWKNESEYVILERVLDDSRIARLQQHLADTGFLAPDQSVDGLDAPTLAAVRAWYMSRQSNADLPVPLRPAITTNLFDGTGVWDGE